MSVRASRPRLPSVGNEVNRLYEARGLNHSNGFEYFVSLFERARKEVVSELREADLDVLNLFDPDKLDILVFTRYPYVIPSVNRLEDIPDDYYNREADYMPGKPFGFSDVA
ncbi:MAG TPA: hypothetical protein VM050_03325 [Patescibacteria group bacterium]|nr:hypothetical protein [Patescibacteria group bacterium]